MLVKLGIPPSPAISMKPTHKVNSTTRLSANSTINTANINTTPTLSNVTCTNDPSQIPSSNPSPMVKELHRNPSDIYSRSYTGIGIVKPRSYSYLTDESQSQAVDKNSSLGSRNRRIPPVPNNNTNTTNNSNNSNNNNSNNV